MVKEIADLVGRDLTDFQVIEITEVYKVNEDGRRIVSLGFFKKAHIAKAFASNRVDANFHKVESVIVLTNGKVAFVLDQQRPVKIFDDEEEVLKLREKIVAKLSIDERRLLGID